jgi:hypothetical protein
MANFEIRGTLGNKQPVVESFTVPAGTESSIKQGDIVTMALGAATLVANGGAVAADKAKFGLALRDSSETTATAGSVEVAFAPEGLVVRGKTTGNPFPATRFASCTIDVVGSVQTIDEDDATGDITIMKIHADGDVDAVLPFKL